MTSSRISDSVQKNVRAIRPWAAAMLFLFYFQGLLAQNTATFEASVSVKEVLVGVPFEATFTLKNGEGTRFTPPGFSGFKKGGTSETRGMSFVNGRGTTSQTWSIELTASKPGTFPIEAASVVSGGRTISTKPLTIKVLSASATNKGNVSAPPGSDDRVFVVADFEPKEAVLGQQVTWRIRLYTQLSVEGYDILALPDFEGFFSKEKVRYDKRVEYLSLRGGKKYAVRTLHEEALFPQEAGEISVGAARVSVGIEQPGSQGFLFGPKPVTLQTQPVVLLVNDLPQPLPPEFTGGVGRYEWEVRADTNVLSTDDALTLVVEINGNGDTRRFAAPKISVPTNYEIFDPRVLEEEEYEGAEQILHRRKLEYVVLPKDTGYQTITPTFSYFDTDSNRYVQRRAQPISVRVIPGKNFQSPNAPLPPAATLQAPSPSLNETIAKWLAAPWVWVVLAAPFVLMGLFALFKKRRRPIDAAPAPLPPVRPDVRERLARVAQLAQGNDPHQFYGELFRALQAWLSARLGLQPAQMNDVDLSKALLARGATPIRTQALLSVWHTCEQAIYGGQAPAEQMRPTWQLAQQVLEALERELR